jgi:hypothetical protein
MAIATEMNAGIMNTAYSINLDKRLAVGPLLIGSWLERADTITKQLSQGQP